MNYELENMIEEGAAADEIGEYMWTYCRNRFNGRYFIVDGKRLYPVIEDNEVVSWEFD